MLAAMTPLYVFIDESGNFDFSNSGTDHFLMAAVIARDPISSSCALQQVKYDLLSEGVDEPFFHASEDKQVIRDRVFAAISAIKNTSAHVISVDKHRAAPALQNTERMYHLFGKAIATYLMRVLPQETYSQIIIVFDKALTNKQENAFLGQIKPVLNAMGRPYRIYFQSVKFDFNGQIADYIAWAHYIALERKEFRAVRSLHPFPVSTFDLFRRGHTVYYPYKK